MLGRKKNSKTKSCCILLSVFLAIGPDTVLAERNCFTAGQIAGVIFVTSFTTFFAVIGIAILLWYFYRNRTIEKSEILNYNLIYYFRNLSRIFCILKLQTYSMTLLIFLTLQNSR